jgi:hypothetical protein
MRQVADNTMKLYIKTENAAFGNGERLREEIARILRVAADKVARGNDRITLWDMNGNRVGEARLNKDEASRAFWNI